MHNATYAPTELLTYASTADLWDDLSNALLRGPLCLTVTHVAKSGMSRRIRVLGVDGDGIVDLTRHVAKLTGYRVNKDDMALVISGCGMDMGFALMEELGAQWGKYAGNEKGYRFGGWFANGMPYDTDRDIKDSAPWPITKDSNGYTRKFWRWL